MIPKIVKVHLTNYVSYEISESRKLWLLVYLFPLNLLVNLHNLFISFAKKTNSSLELSNIYVTPKLFPKQ